LPYFFHNDRQRLRKAGRVRSVKIIQHSKQQHWILSNNYKNGGELFNIQRLVYTASIFLKYIIISTTQPSTLFHHPQQLQQQHLQSKSISTILKKFFVKI
jgi:hypothetical protein